MGKPSKFSLKTFLFTIKKICTSPSRIIENCNPKLLTWVAGSCAIFVLCKYLHRNEVKKIENPNLRQ